MEAPSGSAHNGVMPKEATRWIHRSCAICEATCGLRFEVDAERREVLRIEGNPEDPISRGHLCPKAYAMKGVFEDPDRLRRPLRRTKGGFQEVGWDEAIDEAASRLLELRERHGHEANAIYIGNPTGFDVGAMLYNRVFAGALATPRTFSGATLDHFPKLVTSRILYGKSSILPIPDIDRTDYFLCLGGNPLISQGSLMAAPGMRRRLRDLQDRGGKVVVVDPRRTETAEAADEHVFIRPGSDACFLFAIVHVLFAEELTKPGRIGELTDGTDEIRALSTEFSPERVADITGVAAEVTRRIAREFAGRESAVCYGRIGTCTVEFGLLASWLVDVVNLLTGNLDEPGGVMFPRPATGQHEAGGEAPPFGVGRWRTVVRDLAEVDNQLPASAMAEEMEPASAGERRIRGFVTVAGNPVLSTPNGGRLSKALNELEFMLSLDIYQNETTRHADIILPNASLLEDENFDFLTQTTTVRNFARASERVFEREADVLPQWEVMLRLAARLTGTTPAALDEQMLQQAANRMVGRKGLPAEHVEVATALAQVGSEIGPMRQIDLMLRSGPYGDGFDDEGEGVSLAKLLAARGAIDLGPLTPRFPEILRAPGGRIPLADPFITGDVERLRRRLAERGKPGLLLVGRRQQRNMNSWLHNLPVLAKGPARCTLLVHPEDAQRCALEEGGSARVVSRVGEVIVPVEISDEMMPGVVSLPHGFGHLDSETRTQVAEQKQPGVNANALTDDATLDPLTGTSVVNGVPVTVAPVN
jgi:anaerobic selenocysteine-containing dehydrogenase